MDLLKPFKIVIEVQKMLFVESIAGMILVNLGFILITLFGWFWGHGIIKFEGQKCKGERS